MTRREREKLYAIHHEIRTLKSAAEYALAAAGEVSEAARYERLGASVRVGRSGVAKRFRAEAVELLRAARELAKTHPDTEETWGESLDVAIEEA